MFVYMCARIFTQTVSSGGRWYCGTLGWQQPVKDTSCVTDIWKWPLCFSLYLCELICTILRQTTTKKQETARAVVPVGQSLRNVVKQTNVALKQTGVNKHSLVMGRAIAVYISCSLLAGSPTPWTKQKSFSSVVYVTVFCCFPFQIREQNLQDIKTAGPQSQVLSGVVVDRSLVQVREQNA